MPLELFSALATKQYSEPNDKGFEGKIIGKGGLI